MLGKWRNIALTDIAIRNAKPCVKPYKLDDAGGMFLLVQPTGGKLWRLKYRVGSTEKKLGLGTYPEVSLSEARKRRDDARELVAAGKDPSRQFPASIARSGGAMALRRGHLQRLFAANIFCPC